MAQNCFATRRIVSAEMVAEGVESAPAASMTIERNFDVPFIAAMALREKQVQQNYRPIIAVHKWFARRPGTLFRGLLLAEFGEKRVRDAFFHANGFSGCVVADPFMGGGTPLVEANRVGCDVIGWDINPMAWWIVRQELEHLDLRAYQVAAKSLIENLREQIGPLYRTACLQCGSQEAEVKYFLWVKTAPCPGCHKEVDLFPGYLIAEDKRHPKNVVLCSGCGDLNETADRSNPGSCRSCGCALVISGPARRNRCQCPDCRSVLVFPNADLGPPTHRLFAMEYHCHRCRSQHAGRFFKRPDPDDLARVEQAHSMLQALGPTLIPDEQIPAGDETDRLLRWGYRAYREMFSERQLLALELSCRLIVSGSDERVRNALATNLSDLLRYQNLLCRYDTMALKSLDIFSVHGFPVGLVACESNILGIRRAGGGNVGSGGWTNIVEKYSRAKAYCERPFEVADGRGTSAQIPIPGEWIGDARNGGPTRRIELHAATATSAELPPASLDAVFTDPPYFGNVQYAELMDFCYVWLRKLVKTSGQEFAPASTRNSDELTANATLARGVEHFTEGLAQVFTRMADALKPGAPFAFTYHHNRLDAYYPLAVALLDAGLACTASLPCPAEMGGSIHISGTGSSIVDTVLVNRRTGQIARRLIVDSAPAIASLVRWDLDQLRVAGLKPTQGDIRCITFGHLIRLAIWRLRVGWDPALPTLDKLGRVAGAIATLGGPSAVLGGLENEFYDAPFAHYALVSEDGAAETAEDDAISF